MLQVNMHQWPQCIVTSKETVNVSVSFSTAQLSYFMNQHLCLPGNVLGVAQPCVIDINPLSLKLRIKSLILVLDNDILPTWFLVNFTILWWWNWTGYFSNKTPKIFWSGVMLQVNMHQFSQCIVASKLCFTLMTAMLCCFKAPTHCHFVHYTLFNTDSYTLDQSTYNPLYRIYHNSAVLL